MMLAVEEGGRYAMVYNATTYPAGPGVELQRLARDASQLRGR
jgi:hypothetical protein